MIILYFDLKSILILIYISKNIFLTLNYFTKITNSNMYQIIENYFISRYLTFNLNG